MSRRAERIFDEFLAASARAGDREAFGRLAKRWQPKLFAHAYRLIGEREAARDIAQEVWADIIKGLGGLDDVRVFPAWAFRIVSRRAADMVRRRQRERKLQAEYAEENKNNSAEAPSIEERSSDARLHEAISALPREQRAAVALFYLEDLSVAEISAALRVPAGTVKTRLMHARRKLRAALKGEEDG
ncbi:sigma-70 family RNA polymerase sigma factor [Hyphococcus flavus]|uniref:Sigma-70 family RNA polymerase sigma factor n=1 Tax=Hyphococcus flavus TaxID=1866326 RepID=A0AAF0CFF0_9PROT|nr:sigma-70 family RNA polymerase sigma factor [Hyphococcus flavus]WDI32411.1 sigma-70 family RNA polymerase sigma factor [Hyphococcus flavus]